MAIVFDKKIGFIGGGNMAEAFIRGLLNGGLCLASDICVSDLRKERIDYFRDTFGIGAVDANANCVDSSDLIIIAVKPQNMSEVLGELSGLDTRGKLILSIAAGITISKIEGALRPESAVVRVMPNTPALVGEGISLWARGRYVEDDDVERVKLILGAMGKEIEVGEELMNAATALSGSGPAYIYYLLEAMATAGERLGFSPEQALTIATQTIRGAVRLAESSGQAPEELRKRVTSPGGTTAAAIEVLEERKVKKAIVDAIKAACKRAGELSGE
ncbi:MAG: pyrroline-5-carboxylate reductase [bacterium]|jgi:pyrroline-5-carboxylate reductase